MPPKKKAAAAGLKHKETGERVQTKSPAEFFAENQNIAGFDNVGTCRHVETPSAFLWRDAASLTLACIFALAFCLSFAAR